MKIVAVICEYNPFHLGHEKQFSAVKRHFSENGEEILLLSVMSGNYVQRGEPALLDKYRRANAALLCGADLVMELPYPFSAAPADRFALAGVTVAAGLGADVLAFGSESVKEGQEDAFLQWLSTVADFREKQSAFTDAKRQNGRSLSSARENAQCFERETGLPYPALPNDRLAAEYVRAAKHISRKSDPLKEKSLTLLPLSREKDGYCAHLARNLLLQENFEEARKLLPEKTQFLLQDASFASLAKGMPLLLARLRTASPEEPAELFDIPLEISKRLVSAARAAESDSFDCFFEKLKNKNDSSARLRRSLLTSLFRVTPADIETPPTYALLLGVTEKGRAYLKKRRKEQRERNAIPVFGSLSGAFSAAKKASHEICGEAYAFQMQKQAELQLRAELLYGFFGGGIRSAKDILCAKPLMLP